MTTIAIIGGGIAARSLLFAMAKRNIRQKILVFYSDSFAFPCSVHSTAIVAPRGISTGHSALGDQLVEGFHCFSQHVSEDLPEGVVRVPQFTGALTKLESFKKRYPDGEISEYFGKLRLTDETYIAEEEAFLVRPREYLDWLLSQAKSKLNLQIIPSFVTELNHDLIRTVDGETYAAEKIFVTAGHLNDLWSGKKGKPVQGSYLEFAKVDLGTESFSLTLEGQNLIFDADMKTLLIGSTTKESALNLSPEKELFETHETLSQRLQFPLPPFASGTIRIGIREKASKREPYLDFESNRITIGGFYKNGYALGLSMAKKALESVFPAN